MADFFSFCMSTIFHDALFREQELVVLDFAFQVMAMTEIRGHGCPRKMCLSPDGEYTSVSYVTYILPQRN